MSTTQARPTSWTPQIIALSLVLHVVVLYYVAVAFQVLPPPSDLVDNERTFEVFHPPPPPPPVLKPEIEPPPQPRVRPRDPIPQPLPQQIQPIPLPPQPPAESTANSTTMVMNRPIQETPVVQPLPRYPRYAEDRQIEGRVRLSITIMPDGSVRDVRVVGANPPGVFEAEAVRAVQGWRYRPSGVTRVNVIVDIDFVLT